VFLILEQYGHVSKIDKLHKNTDTPIYCECNQDFMDVNLEVLHEYPSDYDCNPK